MDDFLAVILISGLVNLVSVAKLTIHHYRSIYTASMGFFPYSTEIRHNSKSRQ